MDFHCRIIFLRDGTCTCVKFTSANKTEAMHEMSHVSIKVEPGSRLTELNTSYLASILFT